MDFNITNPFHCELPVQLRFSDLDTLGHVNNSVYLNLFDLGKSIYFERAAGERQDWNNVNVVIANISFTVLQILQNTATGEVKCVCSQVMVYLDPETRMPAPLPQHWRDCFAAFEGRPM